MIVSEFLNRHKDDGLLVLRLGIGLMFIFHGYGKLTGGVEAWRGVGSAMSFVGVRFGYSFWGFMAMVAELGGGLCLILGLFFRPACFMMFFTMLIATIMHLAKQHGLQGASHAIEAGIVFLSLFILGPGPHTLINKLKTLLKK